MNEEVPKIQLWWRATRDSTWIMEGFFVLMSEAEKRVAVLKRLCPEVEIKYVNAMEII